MPSEIYNPTGIPIEGNPRAAAEIRNEFQAIGDGIAKFPAFSTNQGKYLVVGTNQFDAITPPFPNAQDPALSGVATITSTSQVPLVIERTGASGAVFSSYKYGSGVITTGRTSDGIFRVANESGTLLDVSATGISLRGLHTVPFLESGTYTPTLSNLVNCTATIPSVWRYMVVGNSILISGFIEIDGTAGIQANVTASLPTLTGGGTMQVTDSSSFSGICADSESSQIGEVRGDSANNGIFFYSTLTTSSNRSFSFIGIGRVV